MSDKEEKPSLCKNYYGYSREQMLQNLLSRVTLFKPGSTFRVGDLIAYTTLRPEDRRAFYRDFADKALGEGLVVISRVGASGIQYFKRI